MAEARGLTSFPIQAGTPRRVLHTVVALAGWALFAYWWWLVSRRVSEQEVRFTLVLIAIALGVIVLLTAAWVLHNVRIFRNRGPRLHLRSVVQDYSHDTVGRNVRMPLVPEDCLSAAVVKVRLQEGAKVYVPAAPAGGPAAPVRGPERR